MQRVCTCWFILASMLAATGAVAAETDLVLSCRLDNDLFVALTQSGVAFDRHTTPARAIERAPAGAAVLILADGYPRGRTMVNERSLSEAAGKRLRLYIEYPAAVPGVRIGSPRKTEWERLIVASDAFGEALPSMHILVAPDCHLLPMPAPDPLVVAARVAGFDKAVFGLPEERFPILIEIPDQQLWVATTALSRFVTGRFAPAQDWCALWTHLLAKLCPGAPPVVLRFEPPIRPAFRPADSLPADAERRSIEAAVAWLRDSRLLVDASREAEIHKLLRENVEACPMPGPEAPVGDGSHGILEGFSSVIHYDGSQPQRAVLRADCNAESAMCFAIDAMLNDGGRAGQIGRNLLDYVFFISDMHGGVRGDPKHPAFGLIAWGTISPAWSCANYGDDDARVMLATMMAAACLDSDRWDERLMRALLANLRTTGPLGFRGNRIDIAPLEQHGWRHFHDAERVDPSPHYESYLWACYLWAYRHTGHREFLDKTRTAIRMTVEAYPDKWQWNNELERARMLLCLAWLVRVEDTPEHRGWLKRVADGLLECQDAATGAIAVRLGRTGSGHYLPPTSNAEYGTRETPLIQANGDPASDQLYTTGFALLGLREAVAATGDADLRRAEDRLAAYACRIQVRAPEHPWLNGWWFRAFDFKRWDYWASSADAGWGAWSLEAGWAQAWTVATFALRAKETSLWDLTAKSRIGEHLDAVRAMMAVNAGGPWEATGGKTTGATEPPVAP
ncbi:MAG: hypothetical protein JXA69_07775 [Phycisphaerae bacterium]|nr:hypothetical protein [Phycisphaerae bacterium]